MSLKKISENRNNPHSIFVMGLDGSPLTPTTPSKARKLLESGQARKRWSKFGTFGIQMVVETRRDTPATSLGIDHGTKFEGYSVVVGDENVLNVKLDLPSKKKIKDKLEERRSLRRARRHRNCRRRPKRFDNRGRKDFLAPSQKVIVDSRLKMVNALAAIYPISVVGLEDVKFNHKNNRWGSNFSTLEIGKRLIKERLKALGELVEFEGYQTSELRQQYGYKKTSDKSADTFTSHCCDSLTLACHVSVLRSVDIGPFLVVDDTYRPVRRKLHDTQPATGGKRDKYSRGTVFGLRKGLKVGINRGKSGRLCGENSGAYRYYDQTGKRQSAKHLAWISTQFIIKQGSSSCSRTISNSSAS